MRLTLRIAAMAAGLIVALPLHSLWSLFGRPSPWPRRFLAWTGRCAGLRVCMTGTPLQSNVLFVSNHLSWLDIPLIAGATGAAFVSKDDVARWPVIGWLARLNRTVFVARTQRNAVRDQADALRAALITGMPVALFPEGTTDGGTDILPFRASLLASLYPPLSGIRVQPIAIDYGRSGPEIAWVGKESAKANARRVLSRTGTMTVTLHFLPPIDPVEAADRKGLAERSRAVIVRTLGASEAATDPL